MKKNILLVLVTAIITVGITAFAFTYNANDIGYKDNKTVSDALDSLYTTANTTVANLENTNAALLQENETITAQNSSLTNQVAVLQNQVDNSDCVSGTFKCTSCTTVGGQNLNIGFEPNIIYIYSYDFSRYLSFNKNIDATKAYYYSSRTGDGNISNWFSFENDINLHSFNSVWNGGNYQFVACK